MKILKYLTVIVSVIFFASCEKHDLTYAGETDLEQGLAELRIHYVEPLTSGASTRFDSLYINGKLYANSTNAFGVYNVMPNSNKFYAAKAGSVNMKCWRKGVEYDFNFETTPGKQEVFLYDTEQDPKVLQTAFPYYSTLASGAATTWDTDSTAYVEFYNFMYEEYGTKKVPYKGKLQCQYQDSQTQAWVNIGSPAGFGELSGRAPVKVIKTVHNSSGYRTLKYRLVDESGNVLKYTNSSGKEVEYTLSLSTYVGRVYMFYARGIRTSKSIPAGITTKTIH